MKYEGAKGSYLFGTWRASWQIAQVSVSESAGAEGEGKGIAAFELPR